MGGAIQHNAQVHPEIEHFEYLTFGQAQYQNACKFRQRNTGKYGATHFGQCIYDKMRRRERGLLNGFRLCNNNLYTSM